MSLQNHVKVPKAVSGFAALVCGRQPNTSQSLQQSASCLQASTSISRNLARPSKVLDCPVAMVLQSGDYRLLFDQGFPNYSWDHKGMLSKGILVSEVSAPFSANSGNKIGPNSEGMKKVPAKFCGKSYSSLQSHCISSYITRTPN